MRYRSLKLFLYLILASSWFTGCCKDEAIPEPTDSSYRILWQVPIVNDPSTQYSLSSNPAFYGSSVAVTTEYTIDGVQEPLMFFDTATGALTDMWADYIHGTAAHLQESSNFQDDLLILSTLRSIDCVNLNTKNTQWSTKIPNNYPDNYIHNSYVYTSDYTGKTKARILRTPIRNENWETVFEYTANDQYSPFFGSFGFGQNAQGDEVMVWKNRSAIGNQYQSDIFAYNLSQDTLMWINKDFNVFSGVSNLYIDGNRVYGLVQEKAFCLRLDNGHTIWTNDFQGIVPNPRLSSFDIGMFHLSDNHLILKSNGPELVMLHKGNGNLFKINDQIDRGVSNRSTYFEGKLFFSSGSLAIIDVQSGELLNNHAAAKEKFGLIKSKITIDPIRRVMYFHNGRELFCVKIPDNL